jgi:hypothetical protein
MDHNYVIYELRDAMLTPLGAKLACSALAALAAWVSDRYGDRQRSTKARNMIYGDNQFSCVLTDPDGKDISLFVEPGVETVSFV